MTRAGALAAKKAAIVSAPAVAELDDAARSQAGTNKPQGRKPVASPNPSPLRGSQRTIQTRSERGCEVSSVRVGRPRLTISRRNPFERANAATKAVTPV